MEAVGDPRGLDHIRLRQHHAFGGAGGARGVDQGGEVIGLDRRLALGTSRVVDAVAEGHEVVPGQDATAGLLWRRIAAGHHHHVLEGRQIATYLSDFASLLRVLDHQHPHLRVTRDVAHLVRGAGLVDAYRHRPGSHGTEVGQRPFGTIEAEDADRPAGRYVE